MDSFIHFHLGSIGKIFSIFFPLALKARKTKVFYLICFLPVIIAMSIKFARIYSGEAELEGVFIFSNMIMVVYLQFLILILSAFFGTSICAEELEGRTLTYLTTRPIPKSSIILGKYSAYTLLSLLMTGFGVLFSFLVLNVERLLEMRLYLLLLRYAAVLSFGLICYSAFFTLIGTFLRKSIIFPLLFGFGWENIVHYFPGSTQKFTIVHYLKSLLPAPSEERFSFLHFRLEPTPVAKAMGMLFLLTFAFLALACFIFSKKEYLFED